MSSGENSPRGARATKGNRERYAEEIAKMKALGERFSTNQFGKVNVKAFAERCGFSRSVLEGGALTEQFNADVEKIGLTTDIDLPRLRKKVEDKQKMASDLQRQLTHKTAEVEALRRQIEQLQKKVRELELGHAEQKRTLDHMLATGERFFL